MNTPLNYAHHALPVHIFNHGDDSDSYSFDLDESDHYYGGACECIGLSMSLRGRGYGSDRIIFSRTGEYRKSYPSTFFSRLFPASDSRRR